MLSFKQFIKESFGGYGSWLHPDGTTTKVGDRDHLLHAIRFIKEKPKYDVDSEMYKQAFKEGHIRIVDNSTDGFHVEGNHDTITEPQKKHIDSLLRRHQSNTGINKSVVLHGKENTLDLYHDRLDDRIKHNDFMRGWNRYYSGQQLKESTNYGYWLHPDGKVSHVEAMGHEEEAHKILKTHHKGENYDPFDVHNALYKRGYFRVINYRMKNGKDLSAWGHIDKLNNITKSHIDKLLNDHDPDEEVNKEINLMHPKNERGGIISSYSSSHDAPLAHNQFKRDWNRAKMYRGQ